MKTFFRFIIIIVIGLFAGGVYFRNAAPSPLAFTNQLLPGITTIPSSVSPTPAPVIRPDVPIKVEIPAIGVDTDIEPVGLDSDDKMDVPKNPDNVAWYNLGARPGEIGNAVFAGHLDTKTRAAVFYRLNELTQGDDIYVTDAAGKKYAYVVTGKQKFAYNMVPLQEIFGIANTKNLNLITCVGTFDTVRENYSHRYVIYARME